MRADHESASEVLKRVIGVIEDIAKDIEKKGQAKIVRPKREEGERQLTEEVKQVENYIKIIKERVENLQSTSNEFSSEESKKMYQQNTILNKKIIYL